MMDRSQAKRRRVLAVASHGGHWIQLQRILPALDEAETFLATTRKGCSVPGSAGKVIALRDACKGKPIGLVLLACQVAWHLVRLRPDVVLSTGAAPGFFAVVMGRLMGARTIWIDSAANSEVLSISGAKVGRFASLWLTQWPEVSRPEGPSYWGGLV